MIRELESLINSITKDPTVTRSLVIAVMRYFGGQSVYVPSTDYEQRNADIKADIRAGASIQDTAKRYRLSSRTIYRIIGTNPD